MHGIVHLVLIAIVLTVDIVYNYRLIERKKKTPNHYLLWLIRAIVGIAIVYDKDGFMWFMQAITLIPLYWFVFDYGLNKARKKRLTYLGEPSLYSLWIMIKHYDGTFSLLDQLQLKTFGEFPAFCFKLILAIFSIVSMLYNYNPY